MTEARCHSISQGNFISSEPETSGFDLSSGGKWIYPENYPRRDYQFNIVQTALYNNTLVCLPTGLGKTFIAAVVMYNFWRWYPRGKVVFLAPTKPLVTQQINACYEIMGIPSDETIELTGAINQTKRATAWIEKRVIFATPQTFQKDLQNDHVPCDFVKCIVIDEAHKALGKHSYCEIVRMVNEKNKFFRVLALSATPGSKIDHVKEVIQNLLISELELRDDTSPDITPYTNDRSMEQIIVNLDRDLINYKNRYISIMDPHVRVLIKSHILQGSAANISKGRIFMLMKQYESRPNKAQNHGTIMKTLNILLTMYHAYELLLKHGLRAFHHFYSNHSDKFWLNTEVELKLMLEDIKLYIGNFPVIQPSDNEDIPLDVPDNLVFGHSKFKKLQELLIDHFKSFSLQNKNTRAIVFVEYRDIVNEVYVLLLQTRPLIRPQMFVGQAGQKQKQQLAALNDFRNNKVNVLISTSVGEEGLDVGEVDLIVCFDISTSTPTRLVQRMGRTGRKRSGRVVLLLTEGKEVQTLNQAMSKKNSLNNKVLQSSNIASSLYQSSPRMVPENLTPECLAMFIKALPKTPKVKGKKVPTKPAAEKKPRKRKKDFSNNNDCLTSTSKLKTPTKRLTNNHKSAVGNQASMMKFLMDQRSQPKKLFDTVDSGFVEDFQLPEYRDGSDGDNQYTFIRPHEVKLLTCDNFALEFLTLCAMKKSTDKSSTNNTLQLDLRWIPPRSAAAVPATATEYDFRCLKIPSFESLECIRNLKSNEIRNNSDDDSFFPDSNSLQVPQACNYESHIYGEFSRKDKGMNDDNFIDKFENIEPEISAADFFCTFDDDKRQSNVMSKQPSQKNLDEIDDISATDFFSSFTEENPANSTIKPVLTAPAADNDSKKDSQCSSNITPANVEVDFENLLDELDTESETSETPALDPGLENFFDDDLLEAGGSSTDEDLFAEQIVTVVPNLNDDDQQQQQQQQKQTAAPRARGKVSKRSASDTSPCKTDSSPQRAKKRKLSLHVDSDSSNNESTIVMGTPPANNKAVLSVKEVEAEVDSSEEDIFDGLDGDDTLFVEEKQVQTRESNVTRLLSLQEKQQQQPPPSPPPKNKMSASPTHDAKRDFEKNASTSPVFSREDVVKSKNKSFVSENVEQFVQEDKKRISAVELSIDDWFNDDEDDDDFDFVPVEKSVGNCFSPKASSTSTGWISTTAATEQCQPKKKCMMSTKATRPKLIHSNLKLTTTTSKDEDGFAVPAALNVDKENQLPIWRQRMNSTKNNNNVNPGLRKYRSESDLCSSIEKKRKQEKKKKKIYGGRPKARKRIANDFIEDEAEVSSDCNTSDGSDSNDEKLDGDLDSFVSYTQDVSDAIDMRAHYLQTINKSPTRVGAFMIKEVKRKVPDIQVFSQPVSREEMEETYLYDSFCVGDEIEQQINDDHDSEPEEPLLEKMELHLESRRQKLREEKEKKFSKFKSLRKNKREKNESCSEDETETLRKQIMEESIILKR